MAWTLRTVIGLSFGLGCVFGVSGCDDAASEEPTPTATTGASTTGGLPGEGDPVVFTDGWAPIDGNTHGIQGSFYTFNDNEDTDGDGVGGTSVIMPPSFEGAGTKACASGSAGQVMMVNGELGYDDYWGTAIGFNLSQEPMMDAALTFDATANNVAGFSFTLGGANPVPTDGELRFNIKVAGDTHNYCAEIIASGNSTFLLTDLHQDCWLSTAAANPTPNPAMLEALHWQYVTNDKATYTFDLCVEALRVIPITPAM